MARFVTGEAGAGPFAQFAGVVVDIVCLADLVEQAGGIECRMRAASLLVQQEQTQRTGPDFARRHGIPPQVGNRVASASPSNRPAIET